jgi:pyruvate/2-oxoglutarate dehydrogenase complex dihydrolipoamide acyltransferase (E2) component
MQAEVILPELGVEPGQSVVLSVWFADEGDFVYEGDRLVEVLIPGATFDVPSPATGRLAEVLAFPDDELQTGQVLGLVEVEEGQPDEGEKDPPAS